MVSESWVILEIQTYADDTVGNLVNAYADVNQAWSAYYDKLSAAAISEVPLHAVSLLSNEGCLVEYRCFAHPSD